MKHIITYLILVLFSLSVRGQGLIIYTSELQTRVWKRVEPFTDTVKCMILCSDTATYTYHKDAYYSVPAIDGVVRNNSAFYVNGYEIRRHYWAYHPDYSVWNEEMEVETKGYLDDKKKPLKYFVWMSRPLN